MIFHSYSSIFKILNGILFTNSKISEIENKKKKEKVCISCIKITSKMKEN